MVQRLRGQRAGLRGRALGRRDTGRDLDEAVEAAPAAPGAVRAPRRELRHDQPGPAREQGLRGEPVPVESAGPVAGDDDVGRGQQLLEDGPVDAQVERGGPLAESGVGVLLGEFGQPRGVQAEHVRAEQAEGAGGDRPGEDPGEVQYAQPGRGQQGGGGRIQGREHARGCRGPPLALDQRPSCGVRRATARPPAPHTVSSTSRAERSASRAATVSTGAFAGRPSAPSRRAR